MSGFCSAHQGHSYSCDICAKGWKPEADSMWLVVYECRLNVVRVSADGKGFFAPGQEEMWGLTNAEWIREIRPNQYE